MAVPLGVKQAIDGWLDTAGIEKGPIFRRVSASGRVGGDALTERTVWQSGNPVNGRKTEDWSRWLFSAISPQLCVSR